MFDSQLSALAGGIAGIIGFAAFVPYILAILRNETTPDRATWLIWTVVSTISLLSYSAVGAGYSIWYPISDAIAPFVILILSIKYGEGGWTKLDRGCLVVTSIGLFFWWLLNSALVGLCMNLIADAMGAVPTIQKAYHKPASEDRIAWTMTFIALVINLGAIQNWSNFAALVYPIYMLISMGIIMVLLWFRPRKKAEKGKADCLKISSMVKSV